MTQNKEAPGENSPQGSGGPSEGWVGFPSEPSPRDHRGDNPPRSRQLRSHVGAEPNATFRVGADGETGDFKGLTLSNSSPVL